MRLAPHPLSLRQLQYAVAVAETGSFRRAAKLCGVSQPSLSAQLSQLENALGVLHPTAGVAMRATYIIDPEGIIRFVSVTDLDVGRNVDEVLRVLDALQTDELCPCNWQKGEDTLKAA